MFFIKAETQGLGFFVAGKPCAGGMVEENLRLFSISLFAFPFLLFPALFLFPALLSLFFSFFFPFLFPFFLSFFFPLFLPFPLCFPSFIFRFSFPFPFSFLSFCPSFSRSFRLSCFAFPLFSFLFLFPFFLSFFFPSFPSFPLCSLRIKFLCYCKKYGPAAVLMNTQYGTRKYHRPEILQKGVLGQTSSGNRSYT